jgi:hypothetical protein
MLSAPPVPRIPRPVPWRQQPQRAMTIAAGFVCSDGLLFASDTLYSGQSRNHYGPKFWFSEWGEISVVFGGAGPVAGLRRARDEIARRATATNDQHSVVAAIEESLSVVEALLNPTHAWEHRLHVLVGLRVNGKCRLYENDGGSTMISVVDTITRCVGAAQPLGDYFAHTLFRDNMTIEWAKVVAAYLIKQVKLTCSGWTGGSTRLFTLPVSGPPHDIDNKKYMHQLESYLSDINGAMQCVLPDKRVNADTAIHRARQLSEAIREIQKQFVINMQPGRIVISGEPTGVVVPAGTITPTFPQESEDE